jgi:hypothetical protein
MIQILKDNEIYTEVETTMEEESEVLSKANLTAELLNRDKVGEFVARVKPVDPVEPA